MNGAFEFYANLIQIDHPNVIQDEENPNLERYIRFENDPSVGWSLWVLVPSISIRCTFNGQFPFVHQNFITFNLG